jgi:two-component system OmpR family response regulator
LLLLRHRGDVVSKTNILESVWDANYDGDDNVVEVYAGYLRRRIDQPVGRHSIEPLQAMGYRLAAGGG